MAEVYGNHPAMTTISPIAMYLNTQSPEHPGLLLKPKALITFLPLSTKAGWRKSKEGKGRATLSSLVWLCQKLILQGLSSVGAIHTTNRFYRFELEL